MTAPDRDAQGFWLCTCGHEMFGHYPPEDVGIDPPPHPCMTIGCLCQDYERICDAVEELKARILDRIQPRNPT